MNEICEKKTGTDVFENRVGGTAYTPAEVKDMATRLLGVMTMVASLTSTKVDDSIVKFLNDFVLQDWFIAVITNVWNMINNAPVAPTQEEIRNMIITGVNEHVK